MVPLSPEAHAPKLGTDPYAERVLNAIGEGAKSGLSAYEYLLAESVPDETQLEPSWL